jgi:hypothetical protein
MLTAKLAEKLLSKRKVRLKGCLEESLADLDRTLTRA